MSLIVSLLVTATTGLTTGLAAALWRIRLTGLLHAARHEATHDPLTGLPNRRGLDEHLRAALTSAEPLAAALIDLDRFKDINDRLGHHAGDNLLRQIAHRLATLPPPVRIAARLGGDEFVLLMAAGPEQALHAAREAWTVIAQPIRLAGEHLSITASIGVAAHYLGGDADDLIADADTALATAKQTTTGVWLNAGGTHQQPGTARPGIQRHDRRHRHRR